MKYLTAFIFLITLLPSCKYEQTPKDTVKNFILTLKKLDFGKSEIFLTETSRPTFNDFKRIFQSSYKFDDELKSSQVLTANEIINSHSLDSLTETISGNNAIVYSKNKFDKISLEFINGKWKIACTTGFLSAIFDKKISNNFWNLMNETINASSRREYYLNKIIDTATNAASNEIREKENELIALFGKKEMVIMDKEGNSDANSPIYCYTQVDSSNFLKFCSLQNELTDLIFGKYILPHITVVSTYYYKNLIAEEFFIEEQKKKINSIIKRNDVGFGEKINFQDIPVNTYIQKFIAKRQKNNPSITDTIDVNSATMNQ